MNITLIAGARPNFMKIAPIIKAIQSASSNGKNISYRLVHTGQHYDKTMSESFFEQLNIPAPDVNLECGGGSQAEQTGNIMMKFEKELQNHPTDVVLVVGDVNSTMACSITAKKLYKDVVHVEAGIRSGDRTMPEEINRIITDSIADYFFTTSEKANENLISEKIQKEKIHFVGNTMIDTLYQHIEKVREPEWLKQKKITGDYFLLTLHRPSNVDDLQKLSLMLNTVSEAAGEIPIIFPVHPRTQKMLDNLTLKTLNLHIIDPQAYLEFIYLVKNSMGIITDSGGITEEATVLNIPCLTLRNSTERPETVEIGTNELIGEDLQKLRNSINKIKKREWKKGGIPKYWDGKTAERIVSILSDLYQ